MTQLQKLNKNIENSPIAKTIAKNEYYSNDQFISDAKTYIKAIKEKRMICTIESISNSGMSRNLKFNSCEKSKHGYYYRQYTSFFKSLGYTEVKNSYTFRVNGCGMDMIFHTNYSIMQSLRNLGFITKEACAKLAQETPTNL